jgi:hypothetical protein
MFEPAFKNIDDVLRKEADDLRVAVNIGWQRPYLLPTDS